MRVRNGMEASPKSRAVPLPSVRVAMPRNIFPALPPNRRRATPPRKRRQWLELGRSELTIAAASDDERHIIFLHIRFRGYPVKHCRRSA